MSEVVDEGSVEDVIARRARWSLFKGDSYALLRGLPDACLDAVVTDPPYSSGGQFRGDRNKLPSAKYVMTQTKIDRAEFSGDNRDQRAFLAWCALWMGECLRATKPGGVLFAFTDWRQLPVMTDAVQVAGWVWRGVIPWHKVHSRPSLGRFTKVCEYVVWASSGPHEPQVAKALPGFYEFQVLPSDKHHMTGKPTDLMRAMACILGPDSLVFDPFAGSGTTGVGALREGHRFVGVELTEGNYRQASERLQRWSFSDAEYIELTKKFARRH